MQDLLDFVNSVLTVLTAPIMYYLIREEISNPAILSAGSILLFVVVEAVKILCVHCTCSLYIRSAKGRARGRILSDSSFSFTDRDMFPGGSKKSKISLVMGWCMSYISAVIVCHLALILFGAPVFDKWELTLGFSFALVGWLFYPLTFPMRSSSMIKELLCLSSVDTKHAARTRAKWSVLITILGAWAGAVFIPLDWDRPWQQWPVPCMVTSFVTYVCVQVFYALQLGIQVGPHLKV